MSCISDFKFICFVVIGRGKWSTLGWGGHPRGEGHCRADLWCGLSSRTRPPSTLLEFLAELCNTQVETPWCGQSCWMHWDEIWWNWVAKNFAFKLRNNSCLMLDCTLSNLKSLSCQGWRVVNRGGQSCWGDLTTFPLSPLDSARLGTTGWYFGDDYPGDQPYWCGSGATLAMLCTNMHSFWTWCCKCC